jgi:glutathione S-transferase
MVEGAMTTLRHFVLCPHSRAVRLALGELEIACDLIDERPWDWRPEFLAINPSGELPVLHLDSGQTLCGLYAISEYLAERPRSADLTPRAIALMPRGAEDRAEVRRLVDWFSGKLDREVVRPLLAERVIPLLAEGRPATPDAEVLRAARANLRYHASYLGFLAYQRRWLAGDTPTLADLVAAAEISVLDYLGEITWESYPTARDWYQRVKSRPALRPLLADRVPGTPPPLHYTNLDF